MPRIASPAAPAASPPARRTGQPFFTQLLDLVRMELTNWRWGWRSLLVTATLSPLISVVGLGVFARDSGPRALAHVLTGNMVISLMFGTLNNVQSRFCFMRERGALDFFATLPMRREALILAVVASFVLLSLPALLATTLVGTAFLGISVHPHPLLTVVVPLVAVALSAIGAMIGVAARSPQESGSWSLLVTLLMAALGPVVVPPERLPGWLIALGWFSPATWAASALRQTLIGPLSPRLALDLGLLLAVSVLVLGVVARTMDWRQR